MKATGIVRKIDDLGRIVIPAEIRSVNDLNSGTPMEIFLEDGGIVIKKYGVDEEKQQVIKDVEAVMAATENQATKTLMQNVLHYLDSAKYKGY